MKGRKFLKVTGILMIIGGAFGIIGGIVAMIGAGALAAVLETSAGGLMLASSLILASAVFQLIAGIMGVKKTSELIPLCHPLMINKVNIDFDVDRANCLIYAYCTVKCNGKTGVEMEALTGVNVCLLTIYDMCKAVSKDMEIKNVHLVSKSGGKSGDFVWKE